jgi:Trypsin-co-occurring domain 2
MTLGTEEVKVAENHTTLALAPESLRDGLEEAREKGDGRRIRFEVNEVTPSPSPSCARTPWSGAECAGATSWPVRREARVQASPWPGCSP